MSYGEYSYGQVAYGEVLSVSPPVVPGYWSCITEVVQDHTFVVGLDIFTDFVEKWTEDNLPASLLDGGTYSADNGGGNIEVYSNASLTNRIAIKINSFDTTLGTCDIEVLKPSVSPYVDTQAYIKVVAPGTLQPGASDPYGSDEVDNAVTNPNNANLTATEANNTNFAAFATGTTLLCTFVGTSDDENADIFSNIFTDVFSNIFTPPV